jgi:predicted MFS family arabinose efflux permease
MLHSLVATSPVQSGGIRFLHSLLSALYEARAQRAREEIARHADLIASAPWGRASDGDRTVSLRPRVKSVLPRNAGDPMIGLNPVESGRYEAILETARQQRTEYLRAWLREWSARASVTVDVRLTAFLVVFLPLACGYLLSYVFRTINGPLADELIRQFSLDARSLGLLTSVYLLAFALSAIPIGVALDAFGPRLVQSWLLLFAAIGALVFALAPTVPILILGRALIGIGVAGALMAGLKAHALWVPRHWLPMANAALVMFGGLGAVVATLPIEVIDSHIGWRGTFLILALLSVVISIAIFVLLPGHAAEGQRPRFRDAFGNLTGTLIDRRFLRIAPLSAAVVGSAFAIQGLWAARWLTDIDRFAPSQVLDDLFAMGIGLTLGALVIGMVTTRLTDVGAGLPAIFGGFCLAFIALQLVLQLHLAVVPAVLLWSLIGGFSGMSVLSYSILDTTFDSAVIGRANSALNVLHLATAWAVQAAMGVVIAHWPTDAAGHYPLVAYRMAFTLPLVLQIAAFIWFVWPRSLSQLEPESQSSRA